MEVLDVAPEITELFLDTSAYFFFGLLFLLGNF